MFGERSKLGGNPGRGIPKGKAEGNRNEQVQVIMTTDGSGNNKPVRRDEDWLTEAYSFDLYTVSHKLFNHGMKVRS